MVGDTGDLRIHNFLFLSYSNRPQSIFLENVCLAQFATSYETAAKPPKGIEFNKNGTSKEKGLIKTFITGKLLPKFIELKSGGYMRLRNSPSILRIHASNKKKGNEKIFSELLLFLPWRDEKKLKDDCIGKSNKMFFPSIR